MSKFRPDPTDPVANAKGWTRRQRQAKEIEQLRARVEELEERCGTLNTDRLDAMRLVDEWKSKFYDELARVRELEEENRICDEAYEALKKNPPLGIWATPKMIDEAVEYAEYHRLHEIYALRNTAEKIWLALNKLHIFRCEGCGGSKGRWSDEMVNDQAWIDCPDCNGKGWVRKEKDDAPP